MNIDDAKHVPLNKQLSNETELTSTEWEEVRALAMQLSSKGIAPSEWMERKEEVIRLFCRMAEDFRILKEYGPFLPGPFDQALKLDKGIKRTSDPVEVETKKVA